MFGVMGLRSNMQLRKSCIHAFWTHRFWEPPPRMPADLLLPAVSAVDSAPQAMEMWPSDDNGDSDSPVEDAAPGSLQVLPEQVVLTGLRARLWAALKEVNRAAQGTREHGMGQHKHLLRTAWLGARELLRKVREEAAGRGESASNPAEAELQPPPDEGSASSRAREDDVREEQAVIGPPSEEVAPPRSRRAKGRPRGRRGREHGRGTGGELLSGRGRVRRSRIAAPDSGPSVSVDEDPNPMEFS